MFHSVINELFIIISSCSAKKDDSIPIADLRVIDPSYYLDDEALVSKLYTLRKKISVDPKAHIGQKTTYAFDLYVRTGKAYRDLFRNNYHRLKEELLEGKNIEWFFLSGGYGIIHALEKSRKYQATFNQSIAHQNKIPYTARLWGDVLPQICDAIFSRFHPEWVYLFGSRDYTQLVKKTSYWKRVDNIKMFESTGSAGPSWLSPILNNLVGSVFSNNIDNFNKKYPDKLIKQE